MRTIVTRIALTIALAFTCGLVNAAGNTTAANGVSSANNPSLEQAVMHQINKFVAFPMDGDQDRMYGIVDVTFAVDSEGHLVVLDADSENQDLCDYVVRKLARIHVGPNPSGVWKTSHVRFTFRPQV